MIGHLLQLLLLHGGDFKPLIGFLAVAAVAVVLILMGAGWGIVKLIKFLRSRHG